jgi:hypothetical protein
VLTACGAAGVAGPIFMAHVRQFTGAYHGGLSMMALITFVGAVVPLFLRPPVQGRERPQENLSETRSAEADILTERNLRP